MINRCNIMVNLDRERLKAPNLLKNRLVKVSQRGELFCVYESELEWE